MNKDRRKTARGQFSKARKAEIYSWDRAVCAFTGASLWILDYGASGLFQEDWMDHIKPAARKGSHEAANGVCAAASANWVKGANGRANEYWFVGGRPTWNFYENVGRVPKDTARALRRQVEPRDWYFNHCLRNLMWRVANLAGGSDDPRHTKRPDYYPKAAWRFLEQFRAEWPTGKSLTVKTAIHDWQYRRLLPKTLSPDQLKLLDVLESTSWHDIERIANNLTATYRANDKWLARMDRWTTSCDRRKGKALIRDMLADSLVTPRVKDVVIDNVRLLSGLPKPLHGEAVRDVTRRRVDYL